MSGFTINKGSDLSFEFNWPDGAGSNLDLTGYAVDIYNVTAKFESYFTTTILDAATGLIGVNMQWDEAMEQQRRISFRIRIRRDGFDQTTNRLRISVQ